MCRLLINGQWVDGQSTQSLTDKYKGAVYGEMAVASPAQVEEAVAGALAAVHASKLTPYDRYKILLESARIIESRMRQLVDLMRDEAGFTRADGENEVRRCAQTLELSAEESKRLNGELVPMEAASGVKNRMGFTIRVPRGVICAITPFNSPLNTVAHKVGPAIAGGNSVVIKPSNHTPLSAVELCKALIDVGLPSSLLALVHGPGSTIGRQLLEDQRIAFYAFTGSTQVGREIQQAAGLRGMQLELGSIASTIVCHDADIDLAIPKIVNAGFRKAGQVSTSVQRLFVDRRIADAFVPKFIAAVRATKAGDPADPATIVGPMISEQHAKRAASWVADAVKGGAQILTGGNCEGALLQQRDLLAGKDYSFVRLATMGGAPASDQLIDSVAEVFTKAEIICIFGITETSAALFGSHPEKKPRPRHSIGWPIKGNELKLVGDEENFGILHVKGPGMMNGYHNNPAEMEKRLKDGWFNTGDVLRKDAEGWWYFIGRSDDMFVSSGHNIYPLEVELMLERHPDIEQAIVVGVPDEIKHRIPYAFIVKRVGSQLSEEDVKAHALKNAPPYQYPRKVIFVPSMPLNGVGKIDRRGLEARARELSEAAKPVDA